MPEYRTYGARDDRIAKDGDVGFIGFNNRVRPDQLGKGMLADSQNMRLDLNGEAQVRKGIELIEAPFAVDPTDTLLLPFDLPTAGQIGDGVTAILDQSQVVEVYASTQYSDPNDQSSQYIILAANDNAVAKNIQTGATQTIDYTGTQAVGSGATMLQAFNKVFIFREGSTALVWDGDFNNDFELVESGEYEQPIQIVCASGEFAITENRGVVHQQDGVQVGSVIEVLSAKTDPADQTSGLKEGARFDVAKIFTQESSYQSITSATSNNTNLNPEYAGLYRVTCESTGHGYNVGDPIDVTGFGTNNVANGNQFVAEKTDDEFIYYVDGNPSLSGATGGQVRLAHGFEFYINSDGYDGRVRDGLTLTSTPILTRQVSVGLGFTHMPAPPYAIYHQRRLVMPFKYTVNDAENSYTLTGNADEIIASDILDSDTYDQIYAQYRFNAGTADFNVGLHSFANDTLIVFNRNSIHEVRGMIDLKNASSRLITDEVGLVARQSVVQVGSSVIFLSDNGVYNLQFLDEYNLRGGEVPMSEAINATMKRINQNAWEKSVAVYFDNRYFLAVPLDGNSKNNAILVYSFINKQWESVDTVDNTEWDVENLIVAGRGDERGVYAVNALGGVHRLDYREDGLDRVVAEIGGDDITYDIKSSMTTRQYTLGTMERKKWKEFDLHVQSSDDYRSDLTITAETENPDANLELGTLSSFNSQKIQESVTLSGFSDSGANGTYTFTEELDSAGAPIYVYNKGSRSLYWIPVSPVLQVKNELGADIYYGFNPSTSPALSDGSFIDASNGNPVSGSSTYTQGGDSVPTTLAEGEDVSIRGRIGNRRGYGLQFTFNNTTGRPRIRAIEADGSASFRSTTKAD
jgi:hypothetical protein